MVSTHDTIQLQAAAVERVSVALLQAAGAATADAELVARSLVDADLCGHPSHGVLRLPSYLNEIRNGRIDVAARPRLVHQTGSAALLDGAWSFGQVALEQVVAHALELVTATSVGLVGLVRANHCGRLGYWAEKVAAADAWCLLCTSYVSGPYEVAAHGSSSASLGTNPLAYAIPRGDEAPLIGDFATSEIAAGKLLIAQQLNQAAPAGLLFDHAGNPTTTIGEFFAGGALRTFGAHKGSALSLLVDLLSVCLTDATAWSADREEAFGVFLLVINPDVLAPRERVATRVNETADRVRASRPIDPAQPIELPGESEARKRSTAQGAIELPSETWEAIVDEVKRVGAPDLLALTAQRSSA
jgi:uncharacterized oxidoreductase